MANVSVKDWAQQRGYKSVNYDPKTKKISVDGIVFGEPTVDKGVAKMDEFRLDTIYNQQKVDAATGETKANRQKYMDAVNKGYTPGVFKYDRNTDSGYAAAMSASKANLNKSLSQNRWAMSGTGNARSSVALERANQLIADENRRMETEVVPVLEDRAFNRFVQAENTNRAQWQDKVKALADAYNMTNDELKLVTSNLNQSKTQSQTQSNWQSDFGRLVARDKMDDENADAARISNEKQAADTLAAQIANNKAQQELANKQLEEEKKQREWERQQAEKAQKAAGKNGGGSGDAGSSSSGNTSIAGIKRDTTDNVNKLILSNPTLVMKDPVTGSISYNTGSQVKIASIIQQSRLPYTEKLKLFTQYGNTWNVAQIQKDNNIKMASQDPVGFIARLIGDLNAGQINQNQFESRLIYYGLADLYESMTN